LLKEKTISTRNYIAPPIRYLIESPPPPSSAGASHAGSMPNSLILTSGGLINHQITHAIEPRKIYPHILQCPNVIDTHVAHIPSHFLSARSANQPSTRRDYRKSRWLVFAFHSGSRSFACDTMLCASQTISEKYFF